MKIRTNIEPVVRLENANPNKRLGPLDSEIDGSNFIASPSIRNQAPSLQSLIQSIHPVPAYSSVFGTCDDGLPFLMDLIDPTPGSIIIIGDKGSGKSRLLRAILVSAILINPPEKVSYSLITPNCHEFSAVSNQPHCMVSASPIDRIASEIIMDLSGIAEQRRNGRHRDPSVILAIDDFAEFAGERLGYDVFNHFKWLLKEGPKSQIWPIVTLNVHQLKSVDKRLLATFGTLFFSKMHSPGIIDDITGSYRSRTHSLQIGHQFEFRDASEWIRFSLPVVLE